MRLKISIVLVSAMALMMLGAAPALATRRLNCGTVETYFELHNNTGVLCFADEGTLAVRVEGVYLIRQGDNSGYLTSSGQETG